MKQAVAPTSRQTKYTEAVYEALKTLRHATNGQLLGVVRQMYPEVSVTTIHRVTDRLRVRGVIAKAPQTMDATERYDSNTKPHHHFMCTNCSSLCDMPDTEETRAAVELLKSMSKRCKFAGSITLQGTCKDCVKITSKGEAI